MSKSLVTSEGKHITRFGPETEFTGELKFTDNLVIEGKFSGTISATGNLEIDAKSVCSVDTITADTIVVSGQVIGNITAPSRVEMKKGSKITGNVTTKRLRIEDGVNFSGQVTMLEVEEKTPDIFSISSAEYKQLLLRGDNVEDNPLISTASFKSLSSEQDRKKQ
jgi:cytoskeletal protein CcmA (bactofilin family)